MNFAYTGKAQSVTLEPGKYVLECWGAQGGYRSNSSYGGKGGYSTGTLTLTQKTTIYIYVGGSGNSVTSASNSIYPGGFNGGGYRYNYKGGGGATDIRIGSASLYARVIVAGGGGSDGSPNYSGGYAGGVSGTRGNFGCGLYGYGGSQTASYSSLSAINSQGTTNSSSNCAAGFGFGGFGCYYASGYGGAGGGGWYGGQGTYPDGSGDDDGGGGGGSGYVYTSSSASNYPQGCLLNSSYYLSDASNLSGNESFKSPSGATETGHSDNGYCRITCYVKKKTLHCKMNNEIKKAAPVFMKMNNKIYDAGANAVMDFAYTGTAQAISLPRGKYIIECWGAQGGSYSSYYGGAGGYSVGTITLTKNSTDLYIYVGGQPEATTSTGETPGGFNGGGKGCSRTYNYSSYGQGGGGATDVRIGKMIFMLELLSLVAAEVHHQKIRLQQNMAVELLVVLLLLDMELHKLLQVQMVRLVKVVLQQLLELIIIMVPAVVEVDGMVVVHVLIIVTALTTEAIMAEVQDMFTLQLLLLIIQVVIM